MNNSKRIEKNTIKTLTKFRSYMLNVKIILDYIFKKKCVYKKVYTVQHKDLWLDPAGVMEVW